MLVNMKQIVMNFGPVQAVKNVDFSVEAGEIHGLLGENGAGKSTLMNILGGSFPPTSGQIYVDDQPVTITSPVQAKQLKIRFIHQELNLCNDLRVFENIFLGEELRSGLLLDKKTMVARTQAVLNRMKSSIKPRALVSELEPAEKQFVEIARALTFDSRLIIMDEPTTALGQQEIDQLFAVMRELKKQGVCFIYISHKMPEIFEICDRYTVLRDGEFVATGLIADINEKEITSLMVGKELVDADLKSGKDFIQPEYIALGLENFSGPGFENINLSLCKGEVVAVTGLQGSGVGPLVDAVFGAIPYESGSITLNGTKLHRPSIKTLMKHRLAMVPRNRKERGILTDLSIYDNLSMAGWNIKNKQYINLKQQRQQFERRRENLNIKVGNAKNMITSLSGGNQQKVILGRWLETDAEVYLLDNPTQGIDVGAKFEIYKLILKLAEQGNAILVFTNEFPEIYKVADRCLVLYKGMINAELSRDQLSEESIIYYSTGANLEGEKHEQQ